MVPFSRKGKPFKTFRGYERSGAWYISASRTRQGSSRAPPVAGAVTALPRRSVGTPADMQENAFLLKAKGFQNTGKTWSSGQLPALGVEMEFFLWILFFTSQQPYIGFFSHFF